jgi:hypothetical protein
MATDKRQGEFTERAADQAAHQQDRQEHRDQRQRHRQHGEADFACPEQRRLQSRHAFLDVALVMFSSMTMASSTTKPVATVSAISDRLSRLKPSRYIAPKVPISDSGTATLGTSAARESRSIRNTTSTTSAIEHQQRTLDIAQRGADGLGAIIGRDDADAGRNRCLQFRQQRAHAIDDVDDIGPGLAMQTSSIAGLPSARPRLRTSSTPALTVATSCSRTAHCCDRRR